MVKVLPKWLMVTFTVSCTTLVVQWAVLHIMYVGHIRHGKGIDVKFTLKSYEYGGFGMRLSMTTPANSTTILQNIEEKIHSNTAIRRTASNMEKWNNESIFVITPTYSRLEQKASLVRLRQTLRFVPNICWILIEDSRQKTSLVENIVRRSNIHVIHLNITTPPKQISRGVLQRNLALSWIRNHTCSGVAYFADDDNTYDIDLFEEIRKTKGVGVWPVGLVGGVRYESPLVKRGKVVGWLTAFRQDRPFAIDMAGFAVHAKLICNNTNLNFNSESKPGFLESDFVKKTGVPLGKLEPLAENCTQVLVWHTQLQKTKIHPILRLKKILNKHMIAAYLKQEV